MSAPHFKSAVCGHGYLRKLECYECTFLLKGWGLLAGLWLVSLLLMFKSQEEEFFASMSLPSVFQLRLSSNFPLI